MLARICDGVLDAGGALIESAHEAKARSEAVNTLDRRQMLTGAGRCSASRWPAARARSSTSAW